MPKSEIDKPRRRPKQARSQQIVRAIQEACVRILKNQGPDAVTTNRIAQVAGVNIASLYRYFPNKDAIMADVYERQLVLEAEMFEALQQRKGEIDALSVEGTMRLLVETYAEHRLRLLRLHEDFYRRHQLEFDIGSRLSKSNAQSWLEQSQGWLEIVFERHRAALRIDDVPRACFLVVSALQGIMNATVRDRPESLASAEFREDVVQMLIRYLRG